MSRLRPAEWLAAAAGVVLAVTLLLPWYDDRSGFEALTVADILLVLVAAVPLALAVAQATRTSPALPVALGVLTVVAGIAGTLIVLFRLIDSPGADGPAWGAFAGLAAVLAVGAAGWMSIADERVRGVPPGSEPELRPAPQS